MVLRGLRVLGVLLVLLSSTACLGSGGGGGGGDGGPGDGDGDSGDGDSGDGDSGDGDSGDGDSGDGDSGDGDGDSVVDAGPPCVPEDPEVIGEYLLVMRPSSVRNYGDVHLLEIQPNGSLVERWSRTGVDPTQVLPIPRGGFFAYINQLQFSVNVYRISPLDSAVMMTDSVVVSDGQFDVNTSAIHYDDAARTLTTYDTTMAGWYATTFDFVLGELQNPMRSFTGLESYLDPYDGYSARRGELLVYDRSEQFSYRVDGMGITISRRDDNGDYVDPTLFPLAAMMYGSVNEGIKTMVVMSAGVTCE